MSRNPRSWRRAGACAALLVVSLLLLHTLCAHAEQRRFLYQEDVGYYNAIHGQTNPAYTDITISAALTAIGSNKRMLFLPQATWSINNDLTIPVNVQLWIPHGTTVTIADGMTLTLAGCPKIDSPGWLQLGVLRTGKVDLTATGCPVEVHKFSTGGTGTKTSPWTGWEPLLHAPLTTYSFSTGYFRATQPIVLAEPNPNQPGSGGLYTIQGAGKNVTIIEFSPSANGTLLTIGGGGRESNSNAVRDLTFMSRDYTKVKTALKLIDMSASVVSNISVGTPDQPWSDDTLQSVGIEIQGRDTSVYENLVIAADYPMILDGSPNEGDFFNLDRNVFRDLYLIVNGPPTGRPAAPNPNIWIRSHTSLSRNIFSGIVCNLGTYCIYYHGKTHYTVGQTRFESIFFEQQVQLPASQNTCGMNGVPDPTNTNPQYACNWGYMFDVEMDIAGGSAPMFDIDINTVYQVAGNLMKFRGIAGLTLQQIKLNGNYGPSGTCAASGPAYPCNPVVLDIGGRLGQPLPKVNDGVDVVTCIGCAAASGQFIVGPDLNLLMALPRDAYFYGSNPFPSSTMFAYARDVSSGSGVGVSKWHPRLISNGGTGEATYTTRAGLVSVQQVGAKKLLTFSCYIVVASIPGTMSGSAVIRHTDGDVWGTADSTVFHNALTVSHYANIILPSGYTQLGAIIPGGDQHILIRVSGSGQGGQYLPITSLRAGSTLAISGSFVID